MDMSLDEYIRIKSETDPKYMDVDCEISSLPSLKSPQWRLMAPNRPDPELGSRFEGMPPAVPKSAEKLVDYNWKPKVNNRQSPYAKTSQRYSPAERSVARVVTYKYLKNRPELNVDDNTVVIGKPSRTVESSQETVKALAHMFLAIGKMTEASLSKDTSV